MRRLAIALVVVLIVVGAGAAFGAWRIQEQWSEPYKGYSEAERFVDIPPATGAAEIRRRLVEAGVVRDETTFRLALFWTGDARNLKAGEYRFDRPMTVLEVVDILSRGDVYARRLTFPEGLTMREMAALYESREFGTALFERLFTDEVLADDRGRRIGGYGPRSEGPRPRRLSVSRNLRVTPWHADDSPGDDDDRPVSRRVYG